MHKGKVLIVEDEADLLRMLEYNFRSQGYEVFAVRDAETCLDIARRRKPDLFILDVMLPKMDGLELCRILRGETGSPIIFVTARKNEIDKLMGFRFGADDYMVKPFSIRELLVRAEAVLRRVRAKSAPQNSADKKARIPKIGRIEIDADRHEVKVSGKTRVLPPKEYEILVQLAMADGRVLTREQLLERIWGGNPEEIIDARTIDQHIARLRRKLAGERNRLVTVTRSGYRLKTD